MKLLLDSGLKCWFTEANFRWYSSCPKIDTHLSEFVKEILLVSSICVTTKNSKNSRSLTASYIDFTKTKPCIFVGYRLDIEWKDASYTSITLKNIVRVHAWQTSSPLPFRWLQQMCIRSQEPSCSREPIQVSSIHKKVHTTAITFLSTILLYSQVNSPGRNALVVY
jgi:hypothetical protein